MRHGRIVELARELGIGVRVVARVSKGHQQNWSKQAERVRARLMEIGEDLPCIRPVKPGDRWLDESYWHREGV